ncbi:MAG: rhomboid family intramembrane serine protease [Solirubrobacterales bacterium]
MEGNKGIVVNKENNTIIYYNHVSEAVLNEIYQCTVILQKNIDNKKTGLSVSNILIGVNIIIYIITAYLSGNIFDSNINVLIFLGAKVNSLILSGEYYRLITSMFLHGGLVHIGFNMYALYSLGPFVEKIFGRKKFTIIYFFSGILSSIMSFVFSPDISIGASGAIFGLLGAALIFGLKNKNKIGKEFMMNIIVVIGINLFMGFSIPNIDNFAHMGGLIGGILCTTLFYWKK